MEPCSLAAASEEYADFIMEHNNYSRELLEELTGTDCIDLISRQYAAVYVPADQALPLSLTKYSYTSIPKLYTLLDTSALEASGISAVLAQPALSTGGEDVMIGFVDTGISYCSPLFLARGGRTRILGIWDQTLPAERDRSFFSDLSPFSGFSDTSFLYGRQFSEEEINAALNSPNPLDLVPTRDELGHGTFMAGVAAGSETEDGSFLGAAPRCRIGVVKCRPAKSYLRDFYLLADEAAAYQENDIMMGLKYLLLLAASRGLPLVAVLGLGTSQGSHEGTSPLGKMLNQLAGFSGVIPVLAAGNEAAKSRHFLGSVARNEEYEDVELRVADGEKGFVLELWARDPELYTVGFLSPTGERISRIPLTFSGDNQVRFLLEQTEITVNYINAEAGSGSQLIFMRFQAPTAGIWQIRVYSSLFITGEYHMWLPPDTFISENTLFLRSNPDTTVTDPANAPLPITAGAYDHISGGIYLNSGRGFSRSGKIKPELAAPGVNVAGPGRSPIPCDTPASARTGTCAAASVTAGAVASLMSWGLKNGHPEMAASAAVKSYLVRGARRSPAYSYPSKEWGYGELDLYGTFLRMRE